MSGEVSDADSGVGSMTAASSRASDRAARGNKKTSLRASVVFVRPTVHVSRERMLLGYCLRYGNSFRVRDASVL